MPTQVVSKRDLLNEISFTESPLYSKGFLKPYNPNELYQERGNYDLYDDMREDEQVKAVLMLKKRAVLSQGWEIRLNPNGKELVEEKKLLEENLNFWLESSFDNVLMQLLTALDYGFSISEIIWDMDEILWIKDIKTRPPHGFIFFQDDKGNITKIVQQSKSYSTSEINPAKFIRYTYQEEFQNPYGKSDLESAYRSWFSKDSIIKFWNVYLERFSTPTTIATYNKRISSDIRVRLLALLDNIQNKTSLVVPEDVQLSLLEPSKSSTPDFEKAINTYNLMISRSLLMPDLLGLSGDQTGGGSYALGQKHFDLFLFVIKSIQTDLSRTINNSLIRPFFKLNYGIEENFPEFRIIEQTEANKNELAKIWIDAVSKGVVKHDANDDLHLRKLIGFPDRDDISINEEEDFRQSLMPVMDKMTEDLQTQMSRKALKEVKFKKELQITIHGQIRNLYKKLYSKFPDEKKNDEISQIAYDFTGREAKELFDMAKSINQDASMILENINRQFSEFKKERLTKLYQDIYKGEY